MKMKSDKLKEAFIAVILVICLILSVVSCIEVRKTESAVSDLAATVAEFMDYTSETLTNLDERLTAIEAEVYR